VKEFLVIMEMISTLKEIVSLAFVDALEELISNIVVVLDFLSTQQQTNVTGLIILMLVKIKALFFKKLYIY
jgi:hypothetical protein